MEIYWSELKAKIAFVVHNVYTVHIVYFVRNVYTSAPNVNIIIKRCASVLSGVCARDAIIPFLRFVRCTVAPKCGNDKKQAVKVLIGSSFCVCNKFKVTSRKSQNASTPRL